MSESILDTKLRLEQFIVETNPSADVSAGSVFNELVIKPLASLENEVVNDILAVGQENNIESALTSEVDSYNPVIDKIASNYNLVRKDGTKVIGKIKVTVADEGTYFFNSGFVFNQPVLNLNYVTEENYTISSNPDSSELQLYSNNGLFYFIIPVIAENTGSNYQVSDQTGFNLEKSITNFVSAKAYGSFTSGTNKETDKELLGRLHTGLANKTLLTAGSINNRLKELYPDLQDVSVVGAEAPELTRHKQNIFGIATLGMADVYLRTTKGLSTKSLVKTGELQQNGSWVIPIDRTDAPGFYRVLTIVPEDKEDIGTLPFTQVFGFSAANLEVSNTVTTTQEARFSRYQTCELTVTYSPTEPFTGKFKILVSYQPYIQEVQELFLSNSERIICADYLVRSAVPCYVTISLKLHRKNSSDTVDTGAIKKDIYDYVNSLNFGDSLYASSIINICHKYDIKRVELPMKISGQIYTTKSTVIEISNSDVLEIPFRPTLGVTKNTSVFIIDYFRKTEDNTLSDAISIEVV